MRKFQLKNKKVAVLGLGISGFAAAKFLLREGADVFVSDSENSLSLGEKVHVLKKAGAKIELGGHRSDRIAKSDLLVVSPGISLNHAVIMAAQKKGVPITTEMELAISGMANETVGVTGTNGKSTVTSMIRHVLNGCGFKAVSCGNIGNPVIDELLHLKPDTVVVMEMSSFQLSRLSEFQPKAAVLLNITPDHLEWHGSLDAYADAKWSIFKSQRPDQFAVINEELRGEALRRKISSKLLYFSNTNGNPNKNAAVEAVKAFGISPEKSLKSLESFKPLEHRMEMVAEFEGRSIINDSKSTNVDSLVWALNRLENSIVLIAGGRSKDGPFESIADLVEKKVSSLITIGEQRERLLNIWKGVPQREGANSMKEAVSRALEMAPRGSTILLSPACKSFDMFKNYEDRGRIFKNCVHELIGAGAHV